MPKMDYLNAYCRLIAAGEEAEQFKSRLEIWETEIDMKKFSSMEINHIWYTLMFLLKESNNFWVESENVRESAQWAHAVD